MREKKKKSKNLKTESGSSSLSSKTRPQYRKDLIGRTILKSFKQSGDFKGIIQYASEDLAKDGATVYHVQYDDGDTEELQFEELKPFLVPLSQNGTPSKKRKIGDGTSAAAVVKKESSSIS